MSPSDNYEIPVTELLQFIQSAKLFKA